MTREEKLEAIYDEIDRTIVFFNQFGGIEFDWDWENYEFLPIMIWDVLDWIEPYWRGGAQDTKFSKERKRKVDITLLQWDNKRKPIEEQSDECIDFIYSLIKK